ncbi:MAG: DNA internalization-related competence protein ComEC/Rec2 [Candidatus Methylopumilus sp.]|jgi:competence protein ComEC
MIAFALSFVFGAWVLQHMPYLPHAYWGLLLLPLAVLVFISRKHDLSKLAALLAFGFAAGFLWAMLFAQYRLSQALPAEWEGQNIQLVGVIASMPQQLERGDRFEFDVEQVLSPNAVVPQHISLSQYSTELAQSNNKLSRYKPDIPGRVAAPPLAFHAGERWRLTVRLKKPHGTANPYGFDFEAWALERNIRATGYIRQHAGNQLLQAAVYKPAYVVEMLREKIHQHMSRVLAGKPYGGVLQALAIGDESGIVQDDWQVFLRTGTNHLMSISGLHITMLSGLAFALVFAIWRRAEGLTLKLPARKAAVLAGALAALMYALIAGFSVPTQRTIYMLAVFAWALWSGRNVAITRVLAYALLLVAVLDPWAVLAPGFWLSFGAVALISYAVAGRLQRPGWLREAINTQWAVSLGLVPLLLVLFQQVSIISPLANAVAIPLVSLVVVPLTLLGSMLPIDSALQLAHLIMTGCMQLLVWLSSFPLSTWQQHAPPMWTLPIAMIGVLWMLLPRGFPMRWLGLFAFMPMLFITPMRPDQGAMQVSVLDVGQGLAVVVQTQHHNLLYDTGPKYSSQSDSGSRIVVPYLRGAGIKRLDGMIVSHNDLDHSGGMASVLSQVPVAWFASSLPEAAVGVPAQPHLHCFAGQAWTWDSVRFEVLHPDFASYEDLDIKDNNRSCVLRITSQYGSLLLTGDIEKQAEAQLLDTVPDQLLADVVVVPHHGSKTSSTPDFVAAVKPAVAIFTMGYRNRFGHPKPAVVSRYMEIGSKPYRSDTDGAVLLDFAKDKGIQITRWRQQERHYWQE